VRIEQRRRGSPLDKIVAELMILANSTWGKLLAGPRRAGHLPHAEGVGMHHADADLPAPHEGLGVAQYAWSTSPLRRYVDLVNQWQIMAVAQRRDRQAGGAVQAKDADLLAAVADFEGTYAAYADHQSTMERYWCLRWLKQENRDRMMATVLKDGAVRTDIPLVTRVPELMQAVRGTQVLLEIATTDEISLEVSCRVLKSSPARARCPMRISTPTRSWTRLPRAAADTGAEEAAEDAAEGAAEGCRCGAGGCRNSEASEGDQDDEPSAPRDTWRQSGCLSLR
jgi:exoribonuclease-2